MKDLDGITKDLDQLRRVAAWYQEMADGFQKIIDKIDPPQKELPPLYPQTLTIAQHLLDKGSITPIEAAAVYRVRALPRRIADLKAHGWNIGREMRTDATGQRYAWYFLKDTDNE